MANVTQAERISSLEAQVANMRAEQLAAQIATSKTHQDMNGKLDELIALRNKGAGVFWLISIILGTSVIGLATWVASWFK